MLVLVIFDSLSAYFNSFNTSYSSAMKNSLFTTVTVLVLLLMTNNGFGQIPAQIGAGLKSGNANMVASCFNDNVELVILDKENVCSKEQGEMILRDFFSKNKPVDFKLTHQGGTDSEYGIGKLQTINANYRIYFMLKSYSNKPLIDQLRIEKD